jgi:DNA (cytosine-5)-methyltransferase 1
MRPKVISLFTGAGGLDYGFESAGFAHGVALELDADCCHTLRQSRPEWACIDRDVHRVTPKELATAAAWRQGEPAVLIGGPPCQPFSKSGWWAKGDSARLADPRASTLRAYLDMLEAFCPEAFLLENVEGLAYRGKHEGLDLIRSRTDAVNRRHGTSYDPVVLRLTAEDFGVPQMRTRVFVVGLRSGASFRAPAVTHGEGPGLEPRMTAWDALGDLPQPNEDLRMRGKWAELLPSIPEGSNYLWHTDRGGGEPLFGWRRRYWSFLLKLAKDRPAWTIQAQPGPATGPFHWDNRLLSIAELCRLQTFPDDVSIYGNRGSAMRQVGNAVPSLMAEVLARAILEQAFATNPPAGGPALLPARKGPPPPPRQPAPVPDAMLRLRGKHAPHPGTGQGYGRLALRAA